MHITIKNNIVILALFTLLLLGATPIPLDAHINEWIESRFNPELSLLSNNTRDNSDHPAVIYITEQDVNAASQASPDGLVLSNPGIYILAHDIRWTPSTPDSFAITIAANTVTLEGDGHFITQQDTTVKHAIGIQIRAGIQDILIQNLELNTLSGGGIWFRGDNANLIVKKIKTINCGYYGLTQLDAKGLKPKSPTAFTQCILFDGGYGKPIRNAQIIDCTFFETGCLPAQEKYEQACGALLVYQASDITISGCTIDGCVGEDAAWGITLMGISNAVVSDLIITDVFSSHQAEGVYPYDVDGKVEDFLPTAIFSNIPTHQFKKRLEDHGNIVDISLGTINPVEYPLETCHLKGIIPQHAQNEQKLFEEHKWREFRTLHRLVCHNSHVKSKTSAIYAQWIELFCERVLDVKVKVEGGFANLYPDGNTPLPAHRDQFGKWVCGLSFGETRTLEFMPDNKKSEIRSFKLESGDIFLFSPDANHYYKHYMSAEPERTKRRINVTYFLEILPGEDSRKLLHPPKYTPDLIPTLEEAETVYLQKNKQS